MSSPTTTSSLLQLRARLTVLLTDRDVLATVAEREVAALTDEQVSLAVELVDWFDEQQGVRPGLLVSMLRRREFREPRIARGRRDRATVEKWARESGFTEREVPWVVSARLVRGPTTPARMRSHLESSYPWMYGNLLKR